MTNAKLQKTDEVLKAVQKTLTAEGKDLRTLLYRDILFNALKCQRDELDILDLKLINRALAELRHAASVFKPYRRFRKVSIFGSAREPKGSPYYELAVRFAHRLVEKGFMVITGAASGIMQAGIEGAGLRNSFGVNILLPFEKGLAKIIRDDPKVVRFKYFFTRKIFFVMEADAVTLFPGGFGTHDEGFEVLTLLQTGKAPLMPVVLMELPGENYWETWDRFIRRQLLARGFISAEDLSFYKIVRSPEEAVNYITSYYSTYHSLRQVRDKLVIRLEKELKDAHVRKLNDMFQDLVESGKIFKTRAFPEEKDEPNLRSRPRIAFAYNRKSAGRLNEMILTINKLGRSF
ncbi:MAG: LOG family protein [Candidatus Aminicenantes bacterium]|nr:LOG family protein [Candidatus Aminicenantes bacterium]